MRSTSSAIWQETSRLISVPPSLGRSGRSPAPSDQSQLVTSPRLETQRRHEARAPVVSSVWYEHPCAHESIVLHKTALLPPSSTLPKVSLRVFMHNGHARRHASHGFECKRLIVPLCPGQHKQVKRSAVVCAEARSRTTAAAGPLDGGAGFPGCVWCA